MQRPVVTHRRAAFAIVPLLFAACGGGGPAGTPIESCGARDAAPALHALDAGAPIRVLLWNNAVTYGHQSRFTAIPLLQAAANDIQLDTAYAHVSPVLAEGQVDTCSDPSVFTEAGLAPYDVVFFLNTTGATLDGDGNGPAHRQALMDFVTTKGRGFVGTHSATDTYDTGWPWYSDFIGANFQAHAPAGTAGTASHAPGASHVILSAAHVPDPWNRVEEWYAFTRDPTASAIPGVTVLLDCTDATNQFGTRPSAWVHDMPGGGRMFYTAFGHSVSAFQEPAVMDLITAGIRWAAHRLD
ncbi:MAG TPA: ThuA domain-containing protein [Polyangia bacterium]|nr:ThuA domain-containing protein [Polyangia bacterium]